MPSSSVAADPKDTLSSCDFAGASIDKTKGILIASGHYDPVRKEMYDFDAVSTTSIRSNRSSGSNSRSFKITSRNHVKQHRSKSIVGTKQSSSMTINSYFNKKGMWMHKHIKYLPPAVSQQCFRCNMQQLGANLKLLFVILLLTLRGLLQLDA